MVEFVIIALLSAQLLTTWGFLAYWWLQAKNRGW